MKDREISDLLVPILEEFGLELDALEIMPAGKRRLVRVVVDGEGPAGTGPLLDDIAQAARAVSAGLDASPAVGTAPYTLEVTSRGVSRPLLQPRHWRRNAGRLVAATTADGQAVAGRIGVADDTGVSVQTDLGERRLKYSDVTIALVQVEMNRRAADEPAAGGED